MADHADEGEENIEAGENLGEAKIARIIVAAASRTYLNIRKDAGEDEHRVFATYREAFALTSDDHDDEGEKYLRKNVDKEPREDRNPSGVKISGYISAVIIFLQGSSIII